MIDGKTIKNTTILPRVADLCSNVKCEIIIKITDLLST